MANNTETNEKRDYSLNPLRNLLVLTAACVALSATVMAQQSPPDPIQVGKLNKAYDHYAHGYNKSGPDSQREGRDTVMVESTMNYFVMPDSLFNREYGKVVRQYASSTPEELVKWENLKKIKSTFDWKINGSIASFASGAGTVAGADSALRAINWTAAGEDTVRIAENPNEFKGVTLPPGVSLCGSDTAKIPVTVINQPNVMFDVPTYTGASDRVDVLCATDDPNTTNVSYDFPLTRTTNAVSSVIDETGKVTIYYTITKDNGAASTEFTEDVSTGTNATGTLHLTFTDYGSYVITITGVSDRISVKCQMGAASDGKLTAAANVGNSSPANGLTMAENQFNLLIMPQTKAGNTYHIPNGY